jgi:DTW domain
VREAGAGSTGEELDEAEAGENETGENDDAGEAGDADRCERCLLRRRWCLCAEVPRVLTRTRIVIVRHYREVTRSSNSGRLAGLALPNCEIVDHGAPGTPPTAIDGRDAQLLFPGGAALAAERRRGW